ncbi:MAG: hypothetical protein P8184_17535 [Calditrichia bacterium]
MHLFWKGDEKTIYDPQIGLDLWGADSIFSHKAASPGLAVVRYAALLPGCPLSAREGGCIEAAAW